MNSTMDESKLFDPDKTARNIPRELEEPQELDMQPHLYSVECLYCDDKRDSPNHVSDEIDSCSRRQPYVRDAK